ncbi:MAG: LuxR C-terminal-related transcriptional regulator [Chloroflexi bacterium]|nr:LuxR C-terminal-related transcriptional regulator [Chloroflexota bacterium]
MSLKASTLQEKPLLQTKITIPQIPPEFVYRSRLTERVNRGVMGPLTLLLAPAGYGKTNLLIEWTKQTNHPIAWLNIDYDDNDLNRFFRYLIGALQTLEPGLGEEAMDFIQSTRGSGLEVGLTLLINEISALPKEIILVLDDFHTLENSTILEGLSFLLRQLPHNMHLVIASRSEPALDLAFLRAKGRVIELEMEDLRFTVDEAALFFKNAMGQQLPPEIIRMLEKRTDGWITGLQMAAISLRHQTDPNTLLANLQGDAHFLVDFLAEEVLDRQPEDIRQFLLRTSILEILNGSLCEAVVMPEAQPGYGAVMLNRLEKANLFITALDEKHEWFRYHNLFADFLRHILKTNNPAEIPVLQKRAALWFEQNSNLDDAYHYALASGDMEWTANLIERNVQTMLMTGEIFSLTRWVDKLPKEVIRRRPRLSQTYAWGLIAAYKLDDANYWIDDIQQTLSQIENQKRETPVAADTETAKYFENVGLWNVRGGLAICKSTLAVLRGDAEQAAMFSRQAASYLGEENPFIHSLLSLEDSLYHVLSGDTQKAIDSLRETIQIARQANNLLVMVIATCQLADMQALQGRLSQAWATLQKVQYIAVGPDGKPLILAGLADVGFGEILLERDSLEEASAFLENGDQSTQSLRWLSNLDGMVSLAHLRQIQGDYAGAQGMINIASHLALGTDSSQWDDIVVSAVAVRMALQQDDLPEAIQWWKKSGFSEITTNIHLERYPYHIYEYLMLTQARLLIAIGRSQENENYLRQSFELLESIQNEAVRFKRVTSQIEIQILQAITSYELGDIDQATKIFRQALALGEPEGYRRTFLDGGAPVADLLALCQSSPNDPDSVLPSSVYIESLLTTFQSAIRPAPSSMPALMSTKGSFKTKMETGSTIALSIREMEVLSLIAEGKSNQEISAQLYLALNTVKRHAYNIYAKLEVRNRTQAVLKARQLGLIS